MSKKNTTEATAGTIDVNLLGYVALAGAALVAYPVFLFGAHYGAAGTHGLISSQTPITTTTVAPSGKG